MKFMELTVWQKARQFRIDIYEQVRAFPKEEKYRLVDQIIRSSRSVAANIAEGHGRYHFKENIHFCIYARGSITESQEHLICAKDAGLVQKDKYEALMKQSEELVKLLNGYIGFLRKQISRK